VEKIECALFESTQIRSIAWLVAVVASGRSVSDMLEANRRGEMIDIDLDRITDNRFFAVLALVAVEHSLIFDKTKTWTRVAFNEALDAAFAATVDNDFKSSRKS
jgi:hypothetical protein